MPRIPTYDRPGLPGPVYPSVEAAAAGFPELARLGEGVALWAGRRLEEQKQRDDASWASGTIARTRGSWTQELIKAREQAASGAPDFTSGFMGRFDQAVGPLLESAPSPEARAMAEERLALVREALASDALVFEGNERSRHRRAQLSDNLAVNAATVRADPGQYDDILAEQLAAIAVSELAAADKDEIAREARSTLAVGQVNALIDRNPGSARQAILDGRWAGALTPAQMESLLNAADVEQRRREVEARARAAEARAATLAEFAPRLRDEEVARAQGTSAGLSDAEIVTTLGSDKGGAVVAELQAASQLYADATALALLAPAEQQALVASYQPGGENFAAEAGRHEAMSKTLANLRAQLAADPAAYALAYSPAVAQAYAGAQTPEDLQRAVELSRAVQLQAGVAEEQTRALSAAQATALAGKIKADPARAGDLLQQEAAAYGSAWNGVYRELVRAGLPAEYQMLATIGDPVARKNAGEALAVPQADLKKLAGDKAGDIEEGIDAAIAPLAATLVNAPDKAAAMRELALSLGYRYGATADAGGAAARAAQELWGQWDFVVDDGYNARAPRGEGDRAADVARVTLDRLTAEDMPDIGGVTPEAQLLTPDQRRALYLEQVKRGTWVTNPTDDGWILLDSIGDPATLANGKPVEIKFRDMGIVQRRGGRGRTTDVIVP